MKKRGLAIVAAGVTTTVFGLSSLNVFAGQFHSKWNNLKLTKEHADDLFVCSMNQQVSSINQKHYLGYRKNVIPPVLIDNRERNIAILSFTKKKNEDSNNEDNQIISEEPINEISLSNDLTYEETDMAINFDEAFAFIDLEWDEYGETVQPHVDQGYIVKYSGDYYHHNTSNFLKKFYQLQPGKQVVIGGINYTCIGIEHGFAYDSGIMTNNYEEVMENATPEIITCEGYGDTEKRLIAKLR